MRESNRVPGYICFLLIGLGGGYVMGTRKATRGLLSRATQEVSGVALIHLDALSRLRLGEGETAIAEIESMLDAGVETLRQNQPPATASPETLRLYSGYKSYRDIFPAGGIAAAPPAWLASVPAMTSKAGSKSSVERLLAAKAAGTLPVPATTPSK